MLSVIIPSRLEPKIYELMDKIEQDICPNQIIVYNDRYGQGKGYALREALKEATGDRFIFIDGDFDIQVFEIWKLLPYLEQYDVVVGNKGLPKKWDRKLLTILSRLWVRLLFNLCDDTQTGIKGFNYRPEWETNGWAYDIEILYNARKAGKKIVSIPIQAIVSDTKSFGDIWKTFVESIKIKFLL
uniref:Putative glycosyltransferase n=1 Tax=viral metagenome TaxID=1070528 RepID=A0A6M3ITK2_9ZZZZ